MSAFPAKGEVYVGGCQHWDDLGGKPCRVLSVERLQITSIRRTRQISTTPELQATTACRTAPWQGLCLMRLVALQYRTASVGDMGLNRHRPQPGLKIICYRDYIGSYRVI